MVGGEDVPLLPSEYDALTEAALGVAPQAITQAELGRRNVGKYLITPTPDGLERTIGILNTLEPLVKDRVVAHEIGHMIEDRAGDFVTYDKRVRHPAGPPFARARPSSSRSERR